MGRNWTAHEWSEREKQIRLAVRNASSDAQAWRVLTRGSRAVLRNYSTSFFLVTRFLPRPKRSEVDVIYAAVRYPDEVVDTFPLTPEVRLGMLRDLRNCYRECLRVSSWKAAVAEGASPWIAGFADVVHRRGIPPEHYLAFLDAMAADAGPRVYVDLDDLIDHYIYGSAIVVGYFLAWVYGGATPAEWPRALEASRDLGIALQLTNFLRDVAEDQRRGRVYLPRNLLLEAGIEHLDCENPAQTDALNRVLRQISGIAEKHYRLAELGLPAFAPDCRVAIQACINVYRRLNRRIGASELGFRHRESVPLTEKLQALPAAKYWRLPLAFLGVI